MPQYPPHRILDEKQLRKEVWEMVMEITHESSKMTLRAENNWDGYIYTERICQLFEAFKHQGLQSSVNMLRIQLSHVDSLLQRYLSEQDAQNNVSHDESALKSITDAFC